MAHYSSEDAVAVGRDARERSIRALLQGLAVDVTVAIVLVLGTFVGDLEWTATYWKILGLTVAKSIFQSAVSYLMRYYVTPKQSKPL